MRMMLGVGCRVNIRVRMRERLSTSGNQNKAMAGGGGSSEESSRHLAEDARLRDIRHVDEDVVGGVTVERRAEALLVEVVADETNAAAEHEQTVQSTDLKHHSVRWKAATRETEDVP